MNCPSCSHSIEDESVLKAAEAARMKRAIAEGEKAMSGAIFAFGKAASGLAGGKLGSVPDAVSIVDSFSSSGNGAAPESCIRRYFLDMERQVEDARSNDLLICLAQNLMGAKLVISQHLIDRFEKEKLSLLELIFYRAGVLK